MSELVGLSSMATRQILAEVGSIFQQRLKRKIRFTSIGGVDAARQIRAGTDVDVVVLASKVMQELEKEGHVAAGSRTAFARSAIAAAIPAGAPFVRLDDEASVKMATLRARKVCYSTGPSGDHLKRLWQRWDIADAMSQRAILAPPGISVGTILARGEADLGFQQLSELLGLAGVQVLGPLPDAIQSVTEFVAGIGSRSAHADDAKAFLSFLRSADVKPVLQRHGMDPATSA